MPADHKNIMPDRDLVSVDLLRTNIDNGVVDESIEATTVLDGVESADGKALPDEQVRGRHSGKTIVEDAVEAESLNSPAVSKISTIPIREYEEPSGRDVASHAKHDMAAPDISESLKAVESSFRNSFVFPVPESLQESELPAIGDEFDDYRVDALIGEGGFGKVYRVINKSLGREEAVKFIRPTARDRCQDIEKRFAREINIISRLQHPNIVRLYRTGMFSNNAIWMATELIGGERLDVRLARCGAMPFDKAKMLTLQLLSGLMEAHRREIIHRDLKPANVMLVQKEGYEDQLIILDFGLSKALGRDEDASVQDLTMSNSRMIYGSPQYMAPEQFSAESNHIGPWTDVYAAGLIFYELLTGRHAVASGTPIDVAYHQVYEELTFPAEWENTAVKKIIQNACAKNPIERYRNAGIFFVDLLKIYHADDNESVLNHTVTSSVWSGNVGMMSAVCEDAALSQARHRFVQKLFDGKNRLRYAEVSDTVLALSIVSYITAVVFILFLIIILVTPIDIVVNVH